MEHLVPLHLRISIDVYVMMCLFVMFYDDVFVTLLLVVSDLF